MEIQRTHHALTFVLTFRERKSLYLWSEEKVYLKRSLLTDWLPWSLNTLRTGNLSQYSQDLFFYIWVKNSDTSLVTVFGVFLLEVFFSTFLETEPTKCLAVTQRVVIVTWQMQFRLLPTSEWEYIQCWISSTQSFTLALHLFRALTHQLKMGNYTLPKDIQDDQWKLQ